MDYKDFASKIRSKYPGSYDDLDDRTLASKIVQKYPQYSDVTFEEPKKGLIKKTWEALGIPEKMALQLLEPTRPLSTREGTITPSIPQTLMSGAPRVLEESARDIGKVLTKTRGPGKNIPIAPSPNFNDVIAGFVSPENILTAGALEGIQLAKPAIRATGGLAAKGLEAISGLEYKTPGVLAEAAKDSSLIRAGGKKAASLIYEANKKVGGEVRAQLMKISGKKEFVEKAAQFAEKGKLSPIEALEARKELDSIKKTVTGEFFRTTREKFDKVAKTAFEKGDAAYQRAVKAEALRSPLPLNKSGGTSIMKTTLASLAKAPILPLASPLVQGVAATGVGMASRAAAPLINNPVIGAAALNALNQTRKVLTEAKAKDYLKKAKGNTIEARRESARRMAIADGWEIPE